MESLKNVFAVSELRNRILFTLALLGVFRVGHHITTPGVNGAALIEMARQLQNTMFGMYDMFSGGNLSRVTIFALGIMPYISASIILQLLTVVWPYLEKLSKEGELGRRKITQYTRYGTIALSIVQALGIAVFLERQTKIAGGLPLVYQTGMAFRMMTVLTLTTGTCLVMWLGEQITERGIGNGMSLIIYSGIVVGLPRAVLQTVDQMRMGQMGLIRILFLLVLMALVVAAIVFVERGHRRVTVQYAKRVVGSRMYGGSSTHIPLKVITGGGIPVVFASSLLAVPYPIPLAVGGRRLPRAHRAAADVADERLPRRADSVYRRLAGLGAAEVHHRRHERDIFLRRHVVANCRRRGHGHRPAGGVAVDHAALRRVHEEDAD